LIFATDAVNSSSNWWERDLRYPLVGLSEKIFGEKMTYIIDEKTTRKLIGMPRALTVVEKVFRDHAAGKVRRMFRQRLRGKQKGLNIMAAWHADWDLFCMRYYTGKLTSSMSLHDGRTGEFLALMNASYLAPLRTAATSGVAAKYLAPANARVLGIIGTGRQATYHAEAIALRAPVETVLFYGRNPERKKKFVRTVGGKIRAKLKEAASCEEVEASSDIIAVCTISNAPILDGRLLKEQALILSIGANQVVKHEVTSDFIRRMDLIVTDDIPTAKADSGDLVAAHLAGALDWDKVVTLDQVVAGKKLQPRPARILFQSNGVGDDALAVGRFVLSAIRQKRVKVAQTSRI
jgi:ornithine cyclodeaminase/alanine dehydrogenase-like protein (mu-crystallin family)